MTGPGQTTTLAQPTPRERETRARQIATEVGEAAAVFQQKLTGRMDRLAARKALAEFVRAYTYAVASPYAVDAEAIAREIASRWDRNGRAR